MSGLWFAPSCLLLLTCCSGSLGEPDAAKPPPSGCATCVPADCPALPARGCPLGKVRDGCECCWQCARGEGEACGAAASPRSGPAAGWGRCAAGLECRRRRKGQAGVCVCKSRYPVCGTDGLTYPSTCQLRAASLRAQSRGERPVEQRNKGPCEQGTRKPVKHAEENHKRVMYGHLAGFRVFAREMIGKGAGRHSIYYTLEPVLQKAIYNHIQHYCARCHSPSIVTPPKDVWNVTGAQIYLSCEVIGVPTPVLIWNKITKGQYGVQRMELLPGDRDNLAIQTRGGPEKHEVTGWVLISPLSKEDAGEYECHASNSKGEATASSKITVVNSIHEIPKTKGGSAEL